MKLGRILVKELGWGIRVDSATTLARGIHGDIDVFKNLAGSDALEAVGGLDEVVAFLSGVFAAQGIGEAKGCIELNGLNKEPGAVRFPIANETAHDTFHSGTGPWVGGLWLSASNSRLSAGAFRCHRLAAAGWIRRTQNLV